MALGDSADNPSFIEDGCLARGYRFVAALERAQVEVAPSSPSRDYRPAPLRFPFPGAKAGFWPLLLAPRRVRESWWALGNVGLGRPHGPPRGRLDFQRLTVRHGNGVFGQICPGWNTMFVYSALVGPAPPIEIFSTDPENSRIAERRAYPRVICLAVSSHRRKWRSCRRFPYYVSCFTFRGTLGQGASGPGALHAK